MKLYAFELPDSPQHEGFLKIGETEHDVLKRIDSEGHELAIQKRLVWTDEVMSFGRSCIDHLLHLQLRERGFENLPHEKGGASEWYKCSVDDVKTAFEFVKAQLDTDEIKRQELCNDFYIQIRNWYYWAAKTSDEDIHSPAPPEFVLRLIIRLLLCFFLQAKGLIPKELFQEGIVNACLTQPRKAKNYMSRYYNTILFNLFFHCLNTPITEREKFYENKSLIENWTYLKGLFQKIPFLNGGLFYMYPQDDFELENTFFFSDIHTQQIYELDERCPVEGILRILSRYKFTLSAEELTGDEYIQAVDPEFIGKVFESLLACIDADTKENRRKVTGSYYTPKEIVDYMVKESLDVYEKNGKDLMDCKILDPACGSGAFPCSLMNEILRRIIRDKKLPQKERYNAKLEILKKVIYGVDIQPIAVQITVLRLFLSLIQDVESTNDFRDNYGISPLPNLETRFICANSLISLERKSGQLQSQQTRKAIKRLLETRKKYLTAGSLAEKILLQEQDANYREDLRTSLEDNGDMTHETAEQMLQWSPYDQTTSTSFFDSQYMFGVTDGFDIIIGNPPYGATISNRDKEYFKLNYSSAKTIKNVQKGSVDTYSLFIEQGYNLIKLDGTVHYIVPISITSSDSATGIHKLLEDNCSVIKVSSYAVRPQPIFENAVVNTSIFFFQKDCKKNQHIFSTKMYRKSKDYSLQRIIQNLRFIDVRDVKLIGRYPKISLPIEKRILKKILSQTKTIKDLIQKNAGTPIFYRTSGGRYFKVITNYSTGSTKEKVMYFDKSAADIIACFLSSNLYFWFYQIFSNNLDLKNYELESFGIPIDKMDDSIVEKIKKTYSDYLLDIESHVTLRKTERYAKIESFKEYKISKSKKLIDRIDDLICPLYGLTSKETTFIKNYELEFRVSDDI
ncbi:MAG: N-6 DNA methylase [Planctomycetaceae bacterium]|jgi:methylase of polypeptide subunit release factors|nr:N-6 DNA methylase [Planctomycetaceae bacterium]